MHVGRRLRDHNYVTCQSTDHDTEILHLLFFQCFEKYADQHNNDLSIKVFIHALLFYKWYNSVKWVIHPECCTIIRLKALTCWNVEVRRKSMNVCSNTVTIHGDTIHADYWYRTHLWPRHSWQRLTLTHTTVQYCSKLRWQNTTSVLCKLSTEIKVYDGPQL